MNCLAQAGRARSPSVQGASAEAILEAPAPVPYDFNLQTAVRRRRRADHTGLASISFCTRAESR
jgi:hypothetical protein